MEVYNGQRRAGTSLQYTQKLEKEKRDLIKYLEDKLTELKLQWKRFKVTDEHEKANEVYQQGKIYQEILDKVKEGNYE